MYVTTLWVLKMEATQKVINENPDSLEISTPAKGGAIKVYGNFDNPESFKSKIDNAISVREYANSKLGGFENANNK